MERILADLSGVGYPHAWGRPRLRLPELVDGEDRRGVAPPNRSDRLMLQVRFGLNEYGRFTASAAEPAAAGVEP